MKPTLKVPRTKCLKLEYHRPAFNFRFQFQPAPLHHGRAVRGDPDARDGAAVHIHPGLTALVFSA